VERFGGILGGTLATLPTTIVPASIGVAARLAGSANQAASLRSALFTVPCGVLIDAGFLWVWRWLPPRLPTHWGWRARFGSLVSASLGLWAVGASCLLAVELRLDVNGIVVLGSLCYAALFIFGLVASLRPLAAPKGANKVSWRVLAARASAATLAIFVAVLLTDVSAVAAGLASTFPAIFLSVMAGLWLAQGESVQGGAVGPMVLGSCAPPAFALLFVALEPSLGIAGAAALCWPLSVCAVSLPVALFLRWRHSLVFAGRDVAAATAVATATAATAASAGACVLPGPQAAAEAGSSTAELAAARAAARAFVSLEAPASSTPSSTW
jgi:hypothetical protein